MRWHSRVLMLMYKNRTYDNNNNAYYNTEYKIGAYTLNRQIHHTHTQPEYTILDLYYFYAKFSPIIYWIGLYLYVLYVLCVCVRVLYRVMCAGRLDVKHNFDETEVNVRRDISIFFCDTIIVLQTLK